MIEPYALAGFRLAAGDNGRGGGVSDKPGERRGRTGGADGTDAKVLRHRAAKAALRRLWPPVTPSSV